jgi:cell division protein FtsI (penicillin-binding protein 3)
MTISYGHGIAVSPLQLSAGVAAIANGGILGKVTLLKRKSWERNLGTRVLNAETSAKMRRLMRQVVKRGTGRKADVTGYAIGGKTGTADKPGRHGYGGRRVVASFVGAFPIEKPRFLILALVDEPKGTERTHGYATGGWVAAPVVRRLVRRMAPLVGLGPEPSEKGKAGPVRKVRF